ncbi:MAG: hypothetical protein II948_03185, partial [Synergistaceae bacterium]|nr:hypothetical protein [Synergistaceae bacterium]
YNRKYREAHKDELAEYKRMRRQAINSARPKAQEPEQEREPAKFKFVPYEFVKTKWQSKSS